MQNLTPSIRQLLGPVSGRGESLRPALVADGTPARVVVPGDWVTGSRSASLLRGGLNYPATHRNAVEYYINASAFSGMAEALLTATGAGHQVVIVGWQMDIDTQFPDNPRRAGRFARRSLRDVLNELAERGVAIKILLWSRFLRAYENLEVAFELHRSIQVCIDAAPGLASHHQKVMIVDGEQGLVAFYGGVDFLPDRYSDAHDVHARVRGPAARQLYDLVDRRWRAANAAARSGVDQAGLPALPDSPPHGHSHMLVSQTRGNPYVSARNDIEPVIRSALSQAGRFVYVEDQYFTSEPIVRALIDALPRIRRLIVLLPSHNRSEPNSLSARFNVLRLLAQAASATPGKVGVFELLDVPNDYVHAKTWIIDDELAIVGSCNCNERGWTTDSEVMVSHVDRVDPPWDSFELSQPHKLRMRLWHQHLRVDPWKLVDPLAGSVYFRTTDRSVTTEATFGRVRAYRILTDDHAVLPWWLAGQERRRDEGFVTRVGQHVRVF